jgi:hypothetical protein
MLNQLPERYLACTFVDECVSFCFFLVPSVAGMRAVTFYAPIRSVQCTNNGLFNFTLSASLPVLRNLTSLKI